MRRLTMVGWMLAVMVVAMLAVGCGSPTGTDEQTEDMFRLSLIGGQAQTFIGGEWLPDTLVVQVTDGNGNPVEGARVEWISIHNPFPGKRGDGAVEDNFTGAVFSLTNAAGEARGLWQVANIAGEQTTWAIVVLESDTLAFKFTANVVADPHYDVIPGNGSTLNVAGNSFNVRDFINLVAKGVTVEGDTVTMRTDLPFVVHVLDGSVCEANGDIVSGTGECRLKVQPIGIPTRDYLVDTMNPDFRPTFTVNF